MFGFVVRGGVMEGYRACGIGGKTVISVNMNFPDVSLSVRLIILLIRILPASSIWTVNAAPSSLLSLEWFTNLPLHLTSPTRRRGRKEIEMWRFLRAGPVS